MNREYINLKLKLKYKIKTKFDVMYRKRNIGLGIDIGNNYIYCGKINNLYIEITILFWTFGFEIKKEHYYK